MRKPEQEQKQQCGHRGNHRAPCSDTRWRLCKKSRRLPLPAPPRVWYPARTSSPLLQPSRLRWQSSSRNSGAGMWNQQTCQLYRRRVGCTQRLLRGWICRIPERNWLLERVPFLFCPFDLLDFEETDHSDFSLFCVTLHKIRVKWTVDSDYVLCWTCQLRGAFLLADAKVGKKL